ncbi:MAG: hypothetical protein COB29_01185 [Sulfitobacter sp.]|nr:MAG: hypothetical protein COB29_01185 [Sulfitobacter sp.]
MVEGSTQDRAFQKFLRWLAQHNLIAVRDLPVFPATQTMTPGAAIKVDYEGNWKARATVNGGPHLHPDPNTRAEYINRKEIAYSNQPIIQMIAAILKLDLRWATITDYQKFFLYLKHLLSEVPSNCVYYRGRYVYCLGKTFGARGTPFAADCFGRLLQDIQQHIMNESLKSHAEIFRRTDDQAILTHTQADATAAANIFIQSTQTARVEVQQEKMKIGVQHFKFDGYLWDLEHQRIGIPKDKRMHMHKTIKHIINHCTRKQCERFQGFLEWITTVLVSLRPHTVDFRANWMATPNDTSIVTLSPSSTTALNRFSSLADQDELWVNMSYFFESPPDLKITTDGSGHGGVGAFTSDKRFLSHMLPKDTFNQHVKALDGQRVNTEHGGKMSSTWIEMVGLWIAIRTFTPYDKCVEWWSDSQAATTTWNNNKSSSSAINYLIIQITFYCATHNISIQARSHPRTTPQAQLADQLSKNILSSFPPQVSTKQFVPTPALRAVDRSIGLLPQPSPTPDSQQRPTQE